MTDSSGAGVTAAIVTFVSTMTMTGGGAQTAPVVGPVTLDNEFLFQGFVMFPMASGASLVLLPCVPSASHCASGSVNPAFASDATYNGQVNFDRSGSWVTEVQVKRGGAAIGSASFSTTF